MRHIQIKFILWAMFVFTAFTTGAQTAAENEPDSLQLQNKGGLVQVAYRKIPQNDVLGGVSAINIQDLTKKNYNTYSLDNMQGYIGG